jgi:uncharacterized protein YjbI with pentapeptide repeats
MAAGLVSLALSIPPAALGALSIPSRRECADHAYKGVKITVEQLKKLLVPTRSSENRLPLCEVDLSGAYLQNMKLDNIDFTGANFQRARLGNDIQNSILNHADFSEALILYAKFDKSEIYYANFDRSEMLGASFLGSQLIGSSFKNAHLDDVDFEGASITTASFDSAHLMNAKFRDARAETSAWRGAKIEDSDFRDADLRAADFEGASIEESDFSGANMNGVSLKSASFDPRPGGLPSSALLGGLRVNEQLRYERSPLGLVAIRSAMKEAGRDEDERRLTYSIERRRTRELIRGTWNENVEGFFRLVMFEWTAGYGLVPGRPLLILFGLIPTFGVVYWFAIVSASAPKIWIVPGNDDLPNKKRDSAHAVKKRGLGTAARALQFSLLSAFQVGWRDLNVGNWLSRLQWQDYSLSATGWVRSVSGFQSLVSVYLLAIWALTFFGKPFG